MKRCVIDLIPFMAFSDSIMHKAETKEQVVYATSEVISGVKALGSTVYGTRKLIRHHIKLLHVFCSLST